MEKAKVVGGVTLHSLHRAAEALGCRVVHALVPARPLAEVVRARAELVAEKQLASVRHTMSLEDQAVQDKQANKDWQALTCLPFAGSLGSEACLNDRLMGRSAMHPQNNH